MNIKTALKRKNKLVGLISEEFSKVITYNSIISGNERPYDVKEAFSKFQSYVGELVDLKTRIHIANTPVFSKIFLLSELKNQAKLIKGINCENGTIAHPYNDTVKVKESIISISDKDKLVKDLEAQIEQIQEELDEFNYKTEL